MRLNLASVVLKTLLSSSLAAKYRCAGIEHRHRIAEHVGSHLVAAGGEVVAETGRGLLFETGGAGGIHELFEKFQTGFRQHIFTSNGCGLNRCDNVQPEWDFFQRRGGKKHAFFSLREGFFRFKLAIRRRPDYYR